MIVHQAIYGDKLGSYALLKTSLTDTELAKRICNVTDLLDRPLNGHLTQPVYRGFTFNNSYLFIKSFADESTLVRKGRVLSHTLIVDQDNLHQLHDLNKLFSLFLPEPNKDPELKSVIFDDENSVTIQISKHTSREAAAINGLLNHSVYSNTLVWIGEKGYLSLIRQVWSQLDGKLRAKITLGVGFNPQKVDDQNLNILYVMDEYENKWSASGFCIVGKEDLGTLESMSSFLLAGHKDQSKPLNDLIKTFGIVPSEIEDFGYLETVLNTYKTLSPTTDYNRLIVLCDLISKYSPDQKVAKTKKHKLLMQIIPRIASASADQISKLKNVDWKGFCNAQQLIGEQIANWITTTLFTLKVDESLTCVIGAAFDLGNEVQWWKTALSDGLKATLAKWESIYALVLWNLFTKDHDLVKTLGNLIPVSVQAEKDLVVHWQKPEHELAQDILVLAKDRKWLTLHGVTALQIYSPEESIKRQLEIDTDLKYFAALDRMGELISDKEFFRLTVKIGERRLVELAGTKVARTPSLLSKMDIKNVTWRQIWLTAIEAGHSPWGGIKKPFDALFTLFEEILNGAVVESELLLRISKSDCNDLSSFIRRAEVWQYLSGDAKSGFLNATAFGCIKLLDNNKIQIDDFESEIRNLLINEVVIKQVVGDQAINLSTKIRLFEELPELNEKEFLTLLNIGYSSSGESKQLGKLIVRKHWKKAAGTIANKISSRKDLEPALTESQSLLGIFERIKLFISGHLSDTISTEEWWDAFSKQCYTKYPKGPTDNGLWGRSDGKDYDLLATGTGREIWIDLLSKMRNGRTDFDAQKLLQEMLLDYPRSNELKQLKNTVGTS